METPPYTPTPSFPVGYDIDLDITATAQSLSAWSLGFRLHDDFDLSPILSDTAVVPSIMDTTSVGTPSDTFTVNTSPPANADEILFHPLPHSLQNDYPIGRRTTRRVNISTSNSQPSLRERFADVMKLVRQFPPGDRPENTLFTPFFIKSDDNFICLLCPASAPKELGNRTQMIQHIAGGHGGSRPFSCSYWYVIRTVGSSPL